MFKNLSDIEGFLQDKSTGSFWVIQKYIEKPLLYYGRKFDIRMWAIVTAKNEIFLFTKGYLRTSSENFDLKNQDNYVHLTNNCLQKHGGNYGQHEDGNTLPLDALNKYFAEMFPEHNPTVENHILPRMRDIVIDTILSVKKELNPMNRKNVFELLGYDFMIDEDLRTWLIEVNTNPYIGVPNDYIAGLLDDMLDDMLSIVVDPLFPPQNPRESRPNNGMKIFKRKENDYFLVNRPNGFELIYCENGSQYHNGPMDMRRPFNKNCYPIPELIPADVKKRLNGKEKSQDQVIPFIFE